MLYIYSFLFTISLGTGVIITALRIRRLMGKSLALDHILGKQWGWGLDLRNLKLTYVLYR